MSDTVLLRATCPAGHTWDVWGDEVEPGRYRVAAPDLKCPTCPPHLAARAESIEPQEPLA